VPFPTFPFPSPFPFPDCTLSAPDENPERELGLQLEALLRGDVQSRTRAGPRADWHEHHSHS